jgi:hypothetical protein
MHVGDLVYFDAFFHTKNQGYASPADYSIACVIVKKYTKEEKEDLVTVGSEDFYDIMINGKIYLSTSQNLLPISRKETI